MPVAQRRRRAAPTAAEAIEQAQEAGQPVETTVDETGQEFLQRPISLNTAPRKRVAPKAGKRVRVYHKRRTTMYLSDCTIGPEEEKEILLTDAEKPRVAPYIVRLQK